MPEYAEIIVTERTILPGRVYRTYEWRGSPSARVRLDPRVINFKFLPWRLHRVPGTFDPSRYAAEYIRMDAPFGAAAWTITAGFVWIRQAVSWFTSRMVLTAMVWGIGWVPEGEMPSAKHLFKKNPYNGHITATN